MNKSRLAFLVLASWLALGLAAPVRAAVRSDETELREIKEVLWPRAYREGDAALLDRLLAEEFQMIGPDGAWSDKASELEHVGRSRWINRSFRFEIRRLEVFENGTAVVAGRGVVIGPESAPDGGYQYQSSNVLIRRDDRWQAISSHVSGFRPLTEEELAVAGAEDGAAGDCASSRQERDRLLALAHGGFELADDAERRQVALELVGCLGDLDPEIRDDVAFTGLSTWLRAGALDPATRLALAGELLPLVEAEEDEAGFRRPFAALALAEVARADRLAPALPEELRRRMVEAAASFLDTTRDHRGFDEAEGWRHATAHGADLVLQLGLHPATTEEEARRLLTALAVQIAPPGVSYVFGEPARLARAAFFIHRRNVTDAAFWDGWFAAVGSPAPFPRWSETFASAEGLAHRHNVIAFLHAIAFAVRANPGDDSDGLGELAHRELMRIERGEEAHHQSTSSHCPRAGVKRISASGWRPRHTSRTT